MKKRRRSEVCRGSMKRSDLWVWLLFLPVVWWAGAITACAIKPDTNLLQILQVLTENWISHFLSLIHRTRCGVCSHSLLPMCQASVFITPRRKIIERVSKVLPRGRMQLPSASGYRTSGTPKISFKPELAWDWNCYKQNEI